MFRYYSEIHPDLPLFELCELKLLLLNFLLINILSAFSLKHIHIMFTLTGRCMFICMFIRSSGLFPQVDPAAHWRIFYNIEILSMNARVNLEWTVAKNPKSNSGTILKECLGDPIILSLSVPLLILNTCYRSFKSGKKYK